MKKVLLPLIICFVCTTVWAQESKFQDEFAGMIQFNSGRVIALAEKIPAEKYEWSPSEGVRNIGQAVMHIASANYFFSMMLGAELPEGIDPRSMEKTVTGKDNIIASLKASYEFIMKTGKEMPDANFADEVSFPTGDKFNKRTTMLIALGHCSEHMGQLVAYARSNEITPPWSEKQDDYAEEDGDK